MKTHLLTLLLIISSFTVNAQKAELIKGRWKYKDIADKEKMDTTMLKQAKMIMNNTEIEFTPQGRYYYGLTSMGKWTMDKEETKVIVVTPDTTIGTLKMPGKTMEMPVRSITAKELVIGMGQLMLVMEKAPPRPVAPAKVKTINEKVLADCGKPAPEDVIIKLVSAVRSKNLDQVMNAACGFGVTTFTLSDAPGDKKGLNLNTGKDEECIVYKSKEKVMDESYGLQIHQFKNGDIKAICVLSADASKALHKKCGAGALTFFERSGLWDYFGNGTNESMGVVSMPNGVDEVFNMTDWYIGGMCTIYNYKAKE